MLLIAYNLRRDKSHVDRILNSISTSHEVKFFILDTRINKDKVEFQKKDKIDISYIPVSAEDSNKQFELTYTLAQTNNCLFYTNIEENVSFTGSLDTILTEDFINNYNIALSYSDTLLQIKNHDTLIPILNTNFPPRIESIPLVIFRKMDHAVAEQAAKNGLSYFDFVSRVFIVKHIPETLSIIWNE